MLQRTLNERCECLQREASGLPIIFQPEQMVTGFDVASDGRSDI